MRDLNLFKCSIIPEHLTLTIFRVPDQISPITRKLPAYYVLCITVAYQLDPNFITLRKIPKIIFDTINRYEWIRIHIPECPGFNAGRTVSVVMSEYTMTYTDFNFQAEEATQPLYLARDRR